MKDTCDDCGSTKGIVGDLKGTLCSDCMDKRSKEHLNYKAKQGTKSITYTKCGVQCNQCGLIDIIRCNEAKPIACGVCGSNDWDKVTLEVMPKCFEEKNCGNCRHKQGNKYGFACVFCNRWKGKTVETDNWTSKEKKS